MFKIPGNPKIEELNKSWTERSYCLSDLKVIKLDTGRFCAWCAEGKLHRGNQKYCSSKCSDSAMAWAYPQKEHGLNVLLARQGWKCNICDFSYMPYLNQVADHMRRRNFKVPDLEKEFSWLMIKRLKGAAPKERRPEVDHIVPIFKGGQSIGLENLQAICSLCHRAKTGKDLSGKRKRS